MRNSAAPIIVNTKPKIASPNCFINFLSLCKTKLLASKSIDFIFAMCNENPKFSPS